MATVSLDSLRYHATPCGSWTTSGLTTLRMPHSPCPNDRSVRSYVRRIAGPTANPASQTIQNARPGFNFGDNERLSTVDSEALQIACPGALPPPHPTVR